MASVLPAEQLDAGRDPGAEKIRFGRREIDAARILAVGEGGLDVLAGAVEIAVAEFDLGERAVGGRITAGDVEIAGRLVHHLDVEHDTVRRRARLVRYLDRLEIVQVLQPPLGPIDQRLVVGIAFGDVEFAPDHVTAGAGIAVDFDALDIGSRSLIDHEGDVDALRGGIAGGAGAACAKG